MTTLRPNARLSIHDISDGTFLVVDGSDGRRTAMVRRLAHLGSVRQTASAGTAIEAIGEESCIIAAVVGGWLQDSSSLQVVRVLRALIPAVPTIVLAADLDSSLVNEARALGAEFGGDRANDIYDFAVRARGEAQLRSRGHTRGVGTSIDVAAAAFGKAQRLSPAAAPQRPGGRS